MYYNVKYKVVTIANDTANKGYANTVEALASDYEHIYHISIEDSEIELDEVKLVEFINKIKENLPVNILFAGGEGCFDRVRYVQELLKKELKEEFNKISFTLITERFNKDDTVNDIDNLKIITQETEEECEKFIKDNSTGNIECFTVDISACANKNAMEESAKVFDENNPGIFDKLPWDTIDTFFYMGGNGTGFTSKDGIDISKEYEYFITKSFELAGQNKTLVIFTHGYRTFHDLGKDGKPLNFESIEAMYKTIEKKLNKGQECYVFSQKQIEGKNETRPVLIKFKKEESGEVKTEEIVINNEGSLYNKSLLLAAKKKIKVIPTQEQQNFLIEAITADVLVINIDSIKWRLQAKNHELAYETVKEKGDKLLIAKDTYREIINKEKSRQDIITKRQNSHDFISASKELSDEFKEVIKEGKIKVFD